MTYSRKYPQVYRGMNKACLMLDKTDGLLLDNSLCQLVEVPQGMKRAEWTDLSLLEQTKADRILNERGIPKNAESLFELSEFIFVEDYQGYVISKRRVKKHLLPTYYVAGVGKKTLREARAYVRSLQASSDNH